MPASVCMSMQFNRRVLTSAMIWLVPASILLIWGPTVSSAGAVLLGMQLLFGFAISAIPISRRLLASTLLPYLLFLLGLAVLTSITSQYYWSPHLQNLSAVSVMKTRLLGESIDVAGYQSIHLKSQSDTLRVDFETRWLGEPPALTWFVGGSKTRGSDETPVSGETVTTLIFPDNGEDNFAMRTLTFDTALGGRTFSASIEMRVTEGTVSQPCSGLWLQTWYEGASHTCNSPTISTEWQRFDLTWLVPEESLSHVLRLAINNLDGKTVQVRNLRVYEETALGPIELENLIPSVPYLTVIADGHRPEHLSGLPLPTYDTWTAQSVKLDNFPSTTTNISLELRPGAIAHDFGGVLLVSSARPDLDPLSAGRIIPKSTFLTARQSFLQGHPNIAGHSLLAILALAISTLQGQRRIYPIFALVLILIFLTGSRSTAVAGLIVVATYYCGSYNAVGIKQSHKALKAFVLALVAVLAIAVFAFPSFKRADGAIPRPAIWSFALRAIGQTPLGGSSQSFAQLWQQSMPTSLENITHAHNMFLQVAFEAGITGVLALLYVSGIGLASAWRHSAVVGVSIASILVLQLFDATLFNSWVFIPVAITLITTTIGRRRWQHD